MTGNARDVGGIVLGWWGANLRPEVETGPVRGFRARLWRADSALDVLAEPKVIALHEALRDHSPRDPLVLAALAQLLSAVEANPPQRIARAFGTGDEPALSNLRFQRLIRIEDRRELAVALRRALPLIGNACSVAALARDFLYWSESVRIRWCFDYFGKAPPDAPPNAPVAVSETEKTE